MGKRGRPFGSFSKKWTVSKGLFVKLYDPKDDDIQKVKSFVKNINIENKKGK